MMTTTRNHTYHYHRNMGECIYKSFRLSEIHITIGQIGANQQNINDESHKR